MTGDGNRPGTFPLITDEGLAELRARIGDHFHAPEPYLTAAMPDAIRHFADGIGDRNPLWRDAAYAARTRWGQVCALPTILYAFDRVLGGYIGGLPGVHAMFAGTDFCWHRPIRAGEHLHSRPVLAEVRDMASRFSGRSVLQSYAVPFTDDDGLPVCDAKSWVIRTQRDIARERSSAGEKVDVKTWTPAEIADISAAYATERPRGAETRWWEDVEPGDALDERLKGPSTVTTFLAWDLGWGGLYIKAHAMAFDMFREHPALGIPNALGVPEPPERVHWDSELAVNVGVPAAYDYGPERISWLGHLMTDWIGDDGFLKRLNVQVRKHNILGDLTRCQGRVARKWVDGDEHLVECEVWGVNQRDERTVRGIAVAVLPSRR